MQLHNPKLIAQREAIAAQLARARQNQFGHLGANDGQSGLAADEGSQLEARLARLDEQMAALTVRARQTGRLRWPQAHDLPGRYLRRGELIGHVIDAQAIVVRLALPQGSGHALLSQAQGVSVRFVGRSEPVHAAQLTRDSLGATRQLPHAALSDAMGGDIITDPKDDKHLQAQRPVVWMDARVPALPVEAAPRLGQRAWVRLEHGWSPLAWQWLSLVSQRTQTAFSAR